MFFKYNLFQWPHLKIRSDLYTTIAFLPVSEFAALRFSQASIKQETSTSVEANAPSNRDVRARPAFPQQSIHKKNGTFQAYMGSEKKKKLRLNRSLVYPLQSFRSPCTAILQLQPVPRRKKTSHNRHAFPVKQKI